MQIPIKCTSTSTLPFQELHALQGGLKIREKRDIEQLKASITEHGFLFPLFVWTAPDGKNHIIAGHGRLQAIAELKAEGYEIDHLPVDYIQAQTLDEAKHILLHEISTYGKLTVDTILDFSSEMVVNFAEMAFPSGELTFRKGTFIDNEETKEPELQEDPETPLLKCICPHCQNTNYYSKTDIEYLLKYKRYNKFTLSTTGVIDETPYEQEQ